MSKTNGIASADRTGGCAFPIGSNQICGETQTLEIIKQFRKLYEDKLQQIQSGGDQENSLQAKISLQQDWIKDLTEQNDMLVRAVEELETDATDRVAMLEEKLRKSAQQGNEVMQKLEDKERMLRQSQEILNRFPIDAEALAVRLQEKDQELSTLRRSTLDMRNALTIEVAEKHDVILNLRRDVQQLEEKYRQANKQTQFKDDIIKELRKEIKQLKGQINPEKTQSQSPSRFREALLEPLPSFHQCCPCVKDLRPLNTKSKDVITYFKRSKSTSKHHPGEKLETTVNQNNDLDSSLNANKSTHDLPAKGRDKPTLIGAPNKQFEIQGQVTLVSKSCSLRTNKNVGDVSSNESIPRNVLPQINFYSERSIPDCQPLQKPRSTLTSGTILHEYYGMKEKGDIFGVVESFNETTKSVGASKYVSVKTFVNNLEENSKESAEKKKDIKKKNIMAGDDSF